MNVTNQNQSLVESEIRYYFIRLTICECPNNIALQGHTIDNNNKTTETNEEIFRFIKFIMKTEQKNLSHPLYFVKEPNTDISLKYTVNTQSILHSIFTFLPYQKEGQRSIIYNYILVLCYMLHW